MALREIAIIEKELNKAKEDKKEEEVLKLESELAITKDALESISEKVKSSIETEKKKLYETLNKQKEEILKKEAEAELIKKTLDEEKKKEEEEAKKLEEEKKKEELEKMDLKDRLAQTEESLKVESSKLLVAMKSQEEKYKKELEIRDLALYREKKLSENKGNIISELVTGATFEEIDKSVELAKKKYEELQDVIEKKVKAELEQSKKLPEGGKGKLPDEKSPAGQGSDNSIVEKTTNEIMAMGPEEFKKYKEEALKGLK